MGGSARIISRLFIFVKNQVLEIAKGILSYTPRLKVVQMIALLIPTGVLLFSLLIHQWMINRSYLWDWRDSIALGFLGIATFFMLTCEGLSLFKLLNRDMMITVWSAALLLLLIALRFLKQKAPDPELTIDPVHDLRSMKIIDWFLLVILVAMATLVGIIAFVVPPHEADVLSYHMGRVVHWIQNQTVAHYAVPDARHLWMPSWPAYAQTNLYLLAGGDRLANMVQWSAMVLSLILSSRMASYLGANIRGQLLAALFVASLPAGIYQASSSLTDYSAASWVVLTGWFVLRSIKTDIGWIEWLGLGFNVALGYLTKGTYVLFALPIIIWFAVDRMKKTKHSEWIKRGLIVTILIIVLISPYWIRNWFSFGSAMGPEAHVEMLSNETLGFEGLVLNFFRQTAIQLASPVRFLNQSLNDSVLRMMSFIGIEPNNPAFTYQSARFGVGWLFPGSESAPLHVAIIVFSILVMILLKQYRNKTASMLVLLTFLGYLLFCGYIRWQGTMRFSFATYLLLAPVVGWVLGQGIFYWLSPLTAVALILYAAPSLFFLRWRPLIGWRPRTATASIFTISRMDMYFRTWREERILSEVVAEKILATGCQQVALRTDSHDREYYWWILLDPLENDIEIEHTLVYPGLENLIDEGFQACAMICTVCSDSPKERDGLWPVNLEDEIKLYLPEEHLDP